MLLPCLMPVIGRGKVMLSSDSCRYPAFTRNEILQRRTRLTRRGLLAPDRMATMCVCLSGLTPRSRCIALGIKCVLWSFYQCQSHVCRGLFTRLTHARLEIAFWRIVRIFCCCCCFHKFKEHLRATFHNQRFSWIDPLHIYNHDKKQKAARAARTTAGLI